VHGRTKAPKPSSSARRRSPRDICPYSWRTRSTSSAKKAFTIERPEGARGRHGWTPAARGGVKGSPMGSNSATWDET